MIWKPIIEECPEQYGYILYDGFTIKAIVRKAAGYWYYKLAGWQDRESESYITSKYCRMDCELEVKAALEVINE